ncbi:organic cation transporter protein-like [Watersipora subatra]|uniref:organic cation transporter protein-like n=1 Tax=Watersipora subatra TaxID=2589382 RepID=UPI00355C7398
MSSKIDGVLETVGALGKYQWIQTSFAGYAYFAGALQFLAIVFHGITPNHRCSLPDWPEDTYQVINERHNESIHQWIPMKNGELDTCHIYTSNHTNQTRECTQYVFDSMEYWGTSLNMQFGMLCSTAYIGTTVKVIFTVGQIAGAVVVGVISDRFGRKTALVGSVMVGSVVGIVTSFSVNIYMFAALRFIIAACYTGAVLAAHIITMEVVGPSHRTYAIAFRSLFWPGGTMFLSLFAYYLQDWNYLQLATSIPGLIGGIAMIFFVKETPHFLVTKGQHEEAERLFSSIAKMNGKTLPHDLIEQLKEDEESAATEKLSEIIHAPVLLKRFAVFLYLWFVAGLGFYGLGFNVTNLLGNVYINNLIAGSAELATVPMTLLSKKLGRKALVIGSLFIGGASLLASTFMGMHLDSNKYGSLMILVYMIGKAGIACVFLFDYFWSSEVFPTTLRSSLVGLCSLLARIGSILAPIIADLSNQVDTIFGSNLGVLIFGITMVIGGFLAFLLPETNNYRMPETIAEANVFRTGRDAYSSTDNKKIGEFSSEANLFASSQL